MPPWFVDQRFSVVTDNVARDAFEVAEGALQTTQPCFLILTEEKCGIDAATEPKRCCEEMNFVEFLAYDYVLFAEVDLNFLTWLSLYSIRMTGSGTVGKIELAPYIQLVLAVPFQRAQVDLHIPLRRKLFLKIAAIAFDLPELLFDVVLY